MKHRNFAVWNISPPMLPLIVTVICLEFLVSSGIVPRYMLPAPSDILTTLRLDHAEILAALWQTTLGATLGLGLSFVVGVMTSALFSVSPLAYRALHPYAVFFQTVPLIAIAPLLVIWFGFGLPTVIASAFLVSLFPIIANTTLGLQSTESLHVDLFRFYGATRVQTFWHLRLPSALPHLFGGLRIAAGLAVIGAVVGEFIGGGGLGEIVDVARTQQRTDKVFAAVLASTLLGLGLISIINGLSWIFLRHWHPSAWSTREAEENSP